MSSLKRKLSDTSLEDDIDEHCKQQLHSHKQIKLANQQDYLPHNNYCQIKSYNKNKNTKCVQFDTVSVYYFKRSQGHQCIPNTGTHTVGMAFTHDDKEMFKIDEYVQLKREYHLDMVETNFNVKKELIKSLNQHTPDEQDDDEFVDKIDLKQIKYLANPQNDLPMNMDFFCPILTHAERTRIIKMNNSTTKCAVDDTEAPDIRHIRKSRETCGCTCRTSCDKDTCECWLNGIGCQLDKNKYPCSCSQKRCKNPFGLKKFDARAVRLHYDQTFQNKNLMPKEGKQVEDEIKCDSSSSASSQSDKMSSCLDILPYEPFDLLQKLSTNTQITLCTAS